jgi:hypothetical protein
MPRDPYVREKYVREVKTAWAVARDYFERFPKDRYGNIRGKLAAPAVRQLRIHDEAVAGAKAVMTCGLCEDTGWVCGNHPGKPWDGDHACGCASAGMPCVRCKPSDLDNPPRPPAGTRIELDKGGWRH